MALKWSGVSTTLGSLVAATIVRVIAGAVGVVWADADSARAITVNSAVPNVIIRTVTSLVRGRGQRPLFPRKRTFVHEIGMSALGQKQTSADLFDHLVGQHEEVVWHFDPERPRGGEIDDEIEFGRLLDWEIAGLGPAQNLVHILSGAPE